MSEDNPPIADGEPVTPKENSEGVDTHVRRIKDVNDMAEAIGLDATREFIEAAKPEAIAERTGHISYWRKQHAVLNPPPRITTGFADLDESLGGGLVAGGMYTISGGTSGGKSTFANTFARLKSAYIPVLLITLENMYDITVRQMLSAQSRIPYLHIERGETKKWELEGAEKEIDALHLFLEPDKNDLDATEKLIEKFVAESVEKGFVVNGAPQCIVIIDQVSWLMSEKLKGFDLDNAIPYRIKNLAKRLKIPILPIVQLTRESGKSKKRDNQDYTIHDLKSSGRWELDSDCVLIFQGMDFSTTPPEITLDQLKNRHGKKENRFKFDFEYLYYDVTNCRRVEKEEDAAHENEVLLFKSWIPQTRYKDDHPDEYMRGESEAVSSAYVEARIMGHKACSMDASRKALTKYNSLMGFDFKGRNEQIIKSTDGTIYAIRFHARGIYYSYSEKALRGKVYDA